MKRLVIILAILLASATAWAGDWWDAEVAGPANNEVIVDTGAQPYRYGSVVVFIHSTLPGTFEFQLRDTNGTTVLHKQKLSVVSGQVDVALNGVNVFLAEDQRLVIISKQALTLGTVSASIWMP